MFHEKCRINSNAYVITYTVQDLMYACVIQRNTLIYLAISGEMSKHRLSIGPSSFIIYQWNKLKPGIKITEI